MNSHDRTHVPSDKTADNCDNIRKKTGPREQRVTPPTTPQRVRVLLPYFAFSVECTLTCRKAKGCRIDRDDTVVVGKHAVVNVID